jgi:membrane-bound lytic murein transglycosylase B
MRKSGRDRKPHPEGDSPANLDVARLVNGGVRRGFMRRRFALILSAVAAVSPLAAGAQEAPLPPAEPPAPAVVTDPRQAAFQAWLNGEFRRQALAAGVRAETLDRELAGLTFNPRVVQLDNAQPDRSATSQLTFAGYMARHINGNRIGRGQRLRSDLAATLSGIEAKHGVPAEILLGFWGIETSYGAVTGNFDLVRSLATLAFEGRRRELFTGELIAALKLLDRGVIARGALVGSWAGATGQPQFLPSSYLAYAIDGSGDGLADIWNNPADTLASVANFVVGKGWKPGQPWAQRVYVPAELDRERVRNLTPVGECSGMNWRHSRWLTVGEFRKLGIQALGGSLPPDETLATLIEPDGPGTGGYLTYGNYRAIMRYNCTNFYALTVTHLADAIRGADNAYAAGGLRR